MSGGRAGVGTPIVETCQNVGDPGRRRLVIIHVAVDPRLQPLRAKLLKAAVEAFTGFAVVFVGGIAERQDGKAEIGQLRRLVSLDELEEAGGGLRRIALAIGACDDHKILLVLELPALVGRHVMHRDAQAARLCLFGQSCRQGSAVAGFGAIEDRQRPGVGCAAGRSGMGDATAAPSLGNQISPGGVVKPGEETADPSGLRWIEGGRQSFELLPLRLVQSGTAVF